MKYLLSLLLGLAVGYAALYYVEWHLIPDVVSSQTGAEVTAK